MFPLWWAGGCAPLVELPRVPIEGGSAEQRETVRAELERFDQWIGPGRLRIRRVRFFEDKRDERDHAGRWNAGRDLVELDAKLVGTNLEQGVRHELCHSLDTAEGLSDQPSQIERLEHLGEPYPSHDWGHGKGLRREAFARLCETGPVGPALVTASACATDGDGEVADQLAAYDFLLEQVWTGYAAPAPVDWVPEVIGGFRLDTFSGVVESWNLKPTIDPDRLQLGVTWTDEEHVLYTFVTVDFTTGEPVSDDPEVVGSATDVPPGLSDGVPRIQSDVGWPEGPAGAAATWVMDDSGLEPPGLRLVYHDGEAWRPIRQGCVLEGGIDFDLFTARDQVWYAWDDGEAVYWAALGDGPPAPY